MIQTDVQEFCKIELVELFQLAYECRINVVGTVKEIFHHKRYIIECFIGSKLAIRCSKRYSQFEALNQVIRMNFKNIDLQIGEFPSKYQIMDRQQTRRRYFEKLLNKIIQIYCQKITNQTNRRLLSTAYVFMKADIQINNKNIQTVDKKTNKLSNSSWSSDTPQIQPKSLNQILSSQLEKKPQKRIYQDGQKLSAQSQFRAFIGTQFLIKFHNEQEWYERYLKIENSCLLIYRHKNQNNFKTIIQLYQAKIQYNHRDKNAFDHFCEKMELDNEPTYKQDLNTLAISHQYDYQKLLIKVKEHQHFPLSTAMELLRKASHNISEKITIEGVFSPIGKVFIIIHSLSISHLEKSSNAIIYLRINANGLVYETRRIMFAGNHKVGLSIKQGFMIPISNAFTNIILDVIMIESEGIIRHDSQQKSIGKYRLSYADFFSFPASYGLEKIQANTIMQSNSLNNYQCLIQLSVINYSSWTSIYADSYANQNDGALIQKLQSIQDTQRLVITVDRVLRVIGNIALFITAFWRNVYLFKYPIMGYSFFIFMINLIIFGSAGLLFQIIIGLIIFVLIYNMPFCNKIISKALNQYIFKYKHDEHRQPLSIDSNELKFRKWTNNLKILKEQYKLNLNGKLQKKQEAINKKVDYWQVTVHSKTFKITQQLPSLLQKVFEVKKIIELVLKMITAVINILQKIFNVFSWADYRKSAIILFLLIFISNVANNYILRGIGVIFCIHRLVKGISFYKIKHYNNNRKLAIFCLRYIINKDFAFLLPNKLKKIETIEERQIAILLMDVMFPVREQQKVKKLKDEIQFLLGVYIDDQQLHIREEKRNAMRAYYLIDIIQSCQARLKLQWISGQQGISDDFQQLKKLTKQQLVIDLWVQSLLINFFLNVPSQLYTTFRPIRSQQSLKCSKYKDQISSNFKKLHI